MTHAHERPARGASRSGLSENSAAAKPLVPAAQDNREEGAAQAIRAADPWAVSAWRTAIAYLASTGRPFTVDDAHELGAPMPDRPNAVGGLMIAARLAGQIRPVGYTSSRRRSRHKGVQRVWVGVTPR